MSQTTEEMHALLQVAKSTLLMEPVALELNDLMVTAPSRRIIAVTECLRRAGQVNETVANLIKSKNALTTLMNEGRRRVKGDVVVAAAILSDLPFRMAREARHA
jgi:hypothetical protein